MIASGLMMPKEKIIYTGVCYSYECGWCRDDECTCIKPYNHTPVVEDCRMRCVEDDNDSIKYKNKYDQSKKNHSAEIVVCWSDCTWVSGCGFCCHIEMKDAAINCDIRRERL